MAKGMDTDRTSGRQDYFRVRVNIPLRIKPLDETELERRSTEVLSHVDPLVPEMEPALICWLDRIERKLDRLLAHENLLDIPGTVLEDQRSVDLSAEGFRLTSHQPISSGQAVLVEFELPAVPILLVRCIGRVTETSEVDQDTGGLLVDVAFETIRQADRDAVVRYTLAVQRQTIRGRALGPRAVG